MEKNKPRIELGGADGEGFMAEELLHRKP